MQVIVNVHAQDANIAGAVHEGKSEEDMRAGDQGLMFGYATDEWDTETLHPYSLLNLKLSKTLKMIFQKESGL
jgi:S-adenosylmethionine synthetase